MKIQNASFCKNTNSKQSFEAIKVKGLPTSYGKGIIKTLKEEVAKHDKFSFREVSTDIETTFSFWFSDLQAESRAINYLKAHNIQITQNPHISLDNFDDFHNFG